MVLHSVAISGFEGPLDLLLELIEEEKMDVTQVALAHVTNQYLERIRAMSTASPEDLAQFLVIAARLILLKSRRLIPNLVLTPEEEEGMKSLEQQLREYQRFRARAKELRERWMSASRAYSRERFLGVSVTFYPPANIHAVSLHNIIDQLIRNLPSVEKERTQALARIISLEERIRELQERVKDAAVTSFRTMVSSGAQKADVIVSFLALLELVKQRIFSAEQSGAFHDILIRRRSSS